MGSVKDLEVLERPSSNKSGRGRFIFSDRYSVFDWGEMPDHIPNKGKSLCISAAYFFEKLESMGIKTHYLGLVEDGQSKRISGVKSPVDMMEVKLFRVLKPAKTSDGYNYSVYKKEDGNLLVPLEVIFRNSLPAGSSVFKRLEKGELELKELGLKKMPVPGEDLEKPFLDVSTKLEESDRYLGWEEARKIAHLSDNELEEIRRVTLSINQLIGQEASKIGLKYEDGKIEFAFDEDRNLVVVDVLGTLDECRFTFKEMPISKEIARLYYRKTSWFKELIDAKKKDELNWKDKVNLSPPPLLPRLKELISMAYCAFTNEITKKEWFGGILPIQEILREISEILDK
ncbi:phosphoribosylaminoimidazolesuccinocarboxamide synthase [bacterium]|nr:phosphoribosylaminoimidazolesuccinocarboxamide synthase [bacterium]MBU4361953.1 phosphoribosylaminoimidazolesuccinocarboxamide synthase [bacterium]MBU4602006.1 phosphoribosylaminoimidazolesuccinocarboxamide synthase [bacterium]